MKVKGLKWIDTRIELTRIGMELNNLVVSAAKYEWKPEFLWTKKEVEEVVELLERAYELVNKEYWLYMLCNDVKKMEECDKSLIQLNSELFNLKQRLAA